MEGLAVLLFIFFAVVVGLAVTVGYLRTVLSYDEAEASKPPMGEASNLIEKAKSAETTASTASEVFKLIEIINNGAKDFMFQEYTYMGVFVAFFSIVVLLLTGLKGKTSFEPTAATAYGSDWTFGILSATSFVVGAATSAGAGYIGMYIATIANGRVTMKCFSEGIGAGFSMAIQGGMVMAFGLTTLGLLNLVLMMMLYKLQYNSCEFYNECGTNALYDSLAAYGLGGSSIAMFGRVGGGIYTKAADVGADLVGKLDYDLQEDDARNPATIADNVGDNVGDIAGMGSDLFGSFAEGTCAAMVILSSSNNCVYWTGGSMYAMASNFNAMCFPLAITASGLLVSFTVSLLATHFSTVKTAKDVEPALKAQLVWSCVLQTPCVFLLAYWLLPASFFVAAQIGVHGTDPSAIAPALGKATCTAWTWNAASGTAGHAYPFGAFKAGFNEAAFRGATCLGVVGSSAQEVLWWHPALCVGGGLWAGLLIGFVTEYYTSNTYSPVRQVATSSATGAATNIIYGLALGYESVVIPVIALATAIYTGFALAQMFGVACAALGMMGTMATCLTIDGFGPIADNAGGIAEMAVSHDPTTRETTDALDAAGNTTAAIGKGFAIGSAAMVALALFGGYCTRAGIQPADVSIMEPMTFFGLLMGSMLPYWFSAMTMKSVGMAAESMVQTCKEQFETEEGKAILAGTKTPGPEWYTKCIAAATKHSLAEMIAPSALVMLSPLLMGVIFGKFALSGLLIGGIVSGIQMALSASNTGGAWDNAKKWVSSKGFEEENTELKKLLGGDEALYKAALDATIIGDTVGDPLKDTSGPAINILMKLMAIIALVAAPFVAATRGGYGLLGCSLARACTA